MKNDPAYYKEIGFMCGLEVHQRLATTHKLFCSCPATISDESDKIIGTISRYQRAVAGELGQIDRSAEFEELKNRKFVYNIREKHTCLVDIDEEPPHDLNREALMLAISFSKAMGMRIIDELQPMRKEVVDGSDPSAFQRTILVGIDGKIEVNGNMINMPTLFLEEESSGIVENHETEMVYDTDRLGIPLVEIDTDPYIPTPAAAKDVALYIGTLIRISGKVQRGIGSIRQDVNVSIKGGNRVEIKGLQEVDSLDKFIENEITRQQRLLELKEVLIKAKASVDHTKDLSRIFKESEVRIVKSHLDKGGEAIGFKLKGFAGALGKEINPDRRLGSEISDYAKMAKVNGLIHSDENLKGYGFTEKEISEIRSELSMGEGDAFIIIAGKKNDVKKAAELAIERAKYALVGVPLETRGVANNDLCTTRFLRPLPSGSRMYPETDARPIMITPDLIDESMAGMPNIEKERAQLGKELTNAAIIDQLLISPKLQLYKEIVKATKADPNFVANTLLQKFTELRRNGIDVDKIGQKELTELFLIYQDGHITKNAVEEVLKEITRSKESVKEIVASKKLGRLTGKELEKIIVTMKKESKSPSGDLRNQIMAKYRLNVDGAELNELLLKHTKK